VDFFDDVDAERSPSPATSASPPPPRRRSGRSSRWQRLALGVVLLILLAFGLTWFVRSCQQNRRVESYREYMAGVDGALRDSVKLGKQLNGIVTDPTRLQRDDLVGKLGELADKQAEIAARTQRFEPPDALSAEHEALVAGMQLRARGYELFRDGMLAVLEKRRGVDAAALASLEGYFAGPDASYAKQFYSPSRRIMGDEGITDVAVPVSAWYLKTGAFEQVRLAGMIEQLRQSARMTGKRGVALAEVSVQPSGTVLQVAKTTDVPATAQFSFRVAVENQGNVIERDVPVTLTLEVSGSQPQEQTVTIGVIKPGETQAIDVSGFTVPADALSKASTLKVQAGPVPEEQVLENNSGTFKFLLQLQ
jgi:hypothetical protein